MNITMRLLLGLTLIGIILISGCGDNKSTIADHDRVIIVLKDTVDGDLKVMDYSENTKRREITDDFKVFFRKELESITNDLELVELISIDEAGTTSLLPLEVYYGGNLSLEKREDLLMKLQEIFESKWYIESVSLPWEPSYGV